MRREEFLDGLLFESVDNDELYDDRWSIGCEPPGARACVGVKGVRVAEVLSEG